MIKVLLLTVLLALLSASGYAQEITGKVVGVHDGDTLTLLTPQKVQVKVRLEGIDAPELKQPFGNASKQSLSDLAFGKPAKLEVTGKDRYRRTLAVVFVNGVSMNLAQVEKGFAWQYLKYNQDALLREAEGRARASRLGLWAAGDAVAPWMWRSTRTKKAAQ